MVDTVAVGEKVRAAKVNEIIGQLTPTVFTRNAASLASSASYQSLPIGTAVTGSDFSHSAGVFTCNRAGVYRVTLVVSYSANATGQRGARFTSTGSIAVRTSRFAASSIQDQTVILQMIITLAASDTITAQYFQDSGGNRDVSAEISFDRLN